MRARYYNTDIKRFINQDVVEGNITNSPSLNRYAYCQGNPVSLLDPFGLSPQISWSAIGHGVLDVLGMIPGIGAVADIANGFWYLSEGDYFSAASSFVSAIPGVGDIAGGIAKGITGCTKISKAIKFATRFASNIGNFALGAYSTATQIYGLWDKYVIKGQPWGDESLGEFFGAAFTGVTTVLSGKGVVDDIANYKNTKHDILTSQCFVEGTLVVTADGNKPIEEIQAGDFVYSTNPETGESEYKEVVQTFENETKELVHITVADEEIVSTPKHPFYVPQKGWTSAVDLKAGDMLVLSNGEYVIVEKVQHEILEAPVKVYNFEVQDFHTYYVGKNSVLVHNSCTPDEAWEAIDDFRKRHEQLNPLGDSIPLKGDGNGTVAFVEVNGQKVFGVNSRLLSNSEKDLGRSMFSNMKKGGFFSGVKAYGNGHGQVFTHAEANSLLKAYSQYGDAIGKNVVMYCDRGTCGICQKNLGYLKDFLGLDSLTVINKNGKTFVF